MKRILIFALVAMTAWVSAMAQNRDKQLTINVTTDTGENLQGQEVVLIQTDYSLSYGTLTLDANGMCQLRVYPGNHELRVERPGYELAMLAFVVPADEPTTSVSLKLKEQVRTPFALTAQAVHDAYSGDNSISLTWNREAPAFFDDFEDYEPFAIQFGEWTGLDLDLEAAAPIVGEYPNRCVMQYAQIINPLTVSPPWWYEYPILRPYSGKQYVGFTRTSSGNANDDWLITPTITVGTENVLMFMAKAADKYDERFQVLVTTQIEQPQPSDFKRLDTGSYETTDYKGWQTFQYDLAEYEGKQVKFAIRYISHYNRYGSFMLMIDDVFVGQARDYDNTLAKAKARRARQSDANPNEVFHIFLDGNEVGTTEDETYVIDKVGVGEHTVGVRADYRMAQSEMVTTNVVISDLYSPVVFLVQAESALSPEGLNIVLVNAATVESYEAKVENGKAEIASLPHGDYVVRVEEGAYMAYQQNITVDGEKTFTIVLADRIVTPYNITADKTDDAEDGTLVLRWNQELSFIDSFEDYDDFATGSFGEWRTEDLDKMPVYPIALGDISNVIYFPGAGTAANPQPVAPMVFNPWKTTPAMMPSDPAVAAPTGNKTIIFFSPQRAKADKWLISPAIDIREGYVLTTTLKSYDMMYTESVEFCVATEGAEPDDFKVVSVANNVPAGQWTLYQTDLSDYAGKKVRLALHYVSYDTFFLQLDDFMVGPESGDAVFVDYGNVLRYDIYVDGVKVGESATPTFTLKGLSDGMHVIGIVAVYKNGESEMGTITVNVTNGVETVARNANEEPQTVYTISGQQVVADGTKLQKGFYIVKNGNQTRKYYQR